MCACRAPNQKLVPLVNGLDVRVAGDFSALALSFLSSLACFLGLLLVHARLRADIFPHPLALRAGKERRYREVASVRQPSRRRLALHAHPTSATRPMTHQVARSSRRAPLWGRWRRPVGSPSRAVSPRQTVRTACRRSGSNIRRVRAHGCIQHIHVARTARGNGGSAAIVGRLRAHEAALTAGRAGSRRDADEAAIAAVPVGTDSGTDQAALPAIGAGSGAGANEAAGATAISGGDAGTDQSTIAAAVAGADSRTREAARTAIAAGSDAGPDEPAGAAAIARAGAGTHQAA